MSQLVEVVGLEAMGLRCFVRDDDEGMAFEFLEGQVERQWQMDQREVRLSLGEAAGHVAPPAGEQSNGSTRPLRLERGTRCINGLQHRLRQDAVADHELFIGTTLFTWDIAGHGTPPPRNETPLESRWIRRRLPTRSDASRRSSRALRATPS